MQTAYFTTDHFIRHTGNVVDLTEYRRRLERASAPVSNGSGFKARQERAFTGVRRRPDRGSLGLFLDFCASFAIVAMTVTVVIQYLAA